MTESRQVSWLHHSRLRGLSSTSRFISSLRASRSYNALDTVRTPTLQGWTLQLRLAADQGVLGSQRTPSKDRLKTSKPFEYPRKEHNVVQANPPKSASCEITRAFSRWKQYCIFIKWAALNRPACDRVGRVMLKNDQFSAPAQQYRCVRNCVLAVVGLDMVQDIRQKDDVIGMTQVSGFTSEGSLRPQC